MTFALNPSLPERRSIVGLGGALRPSVSPFRQDQTPASRSELWTAAAFNENGGLAYGEHLLTNSLWATDTGERVNAVSWLRENYDEGTFERLKPAISRGLFVGEMNPNRIRVLADNEIRYWDRQDIASTRPYEYFFATILAGLADPFGYIPFLGWAGKLKALGKAGRTLVEETFAAGVSEGALAYIQPQRTWEDWAQWTAIGGVASTGLKLGIDGVRTVRTRRSPNHFHHPGNPFRDENVAAPQPLELRDMSGNRDELTSEERAALEDDIASMASEPGPKRKPVVLEVDPETGDPRVRQGYDVQSDATVDMRALGESEGEARLRMENEVREGSVGAARDKLDEDFVLAGRGQGVSGPDVGPVTSSFRRKVGDFFHTKTITGRFVRATSDVARKMAMRIVDPGGMLFEHHLAGRGGPRFAEELKELYMVETERLWSRLRAVQSRLDEAVAERGVAFDEKDFNKAVQRELTGVDDPEMWNAIAEKYGDNMVDELRAAAREGADHVHELNDFWEKKLIERGIVRDDARVSALESELQALRAEVEAAKDPEAGLDIKDARRRRDDVKSRLEQEKAKAPPLGRDYGHAQLWNADQIIRNPSEFRDFLLDVLAVKPDRNWLAELDTEEFPGGLTLEQFEDLKVTDPDAHKAILEEWVGDEWYFRIEKAETRMKAATEADKQAMLDLREMMSLLTKDKERLSRMTLSEARKLRDKVAAEVEMLRQRTATKASSDRLDRRPDNLDTQRQWVRDQKRLEKLEAKLAKADDALREAETKKTRAAEAKRETEIILKDVRKERKVAAKDLKSAKRELLGARKSSPLSDTVDEIVDNLTKHGRIPAGMMDRLGASSERTSARLKERVLHLDADQRRLAFQRGFLHDDLPRILYRSNEQMAGEISLREALDIGEGGRFGSWSEAVDSVDQDYRRLIAEANERGDDPSKLENERKIILDDLDEVRNRLKGSIAMTDGTTNGVFAWTSSKFRAWNYIRFGGGFIVSSMTDAATMALRHGSFFKQLERSMKPAIRMMRQMNEMHPDEFQNFISAMEISQGVSAAARRFGQEDLVRGQFGAHGIGTGRTREITGAIDKATEATSDFVAKYSGLPHWNRFLKTVASLEMSRKLDTMVRGYDGLSTVERADLASLGIGKTEANRMRKHLEAHGSTTEEGVFDPGLEKWDDAEAVRNFKLAIIRDMNRAVNTPGVGDTPRLMTQWYGRMLLQFQTFGFTFLNRFVFPAYQRGQMGDPQVQQAMVTLFASAALVVAGKDVIRGKDPFERLNPKNIPQTAIDIVDRSGLLGWTSPYVDAGLKLTGVTASSRYIRNQWYESPFGVTAALFGDFGSAAAAIAAGDEKLARKLLILGPMSTQTRLLHGAFSTE